MNHSFNIEFARRHGIEEAILIEHIYYWIAKNKANNKHFYNENYWTYNSVKAFQELFPYMTERKIRYTLNSLIKKDFLETAKHSTNSFDNTLLYAITEQGYAELQNCQTDLTKLSNGSDKIVKCIDNNINNIYNTTNINTNINKESIINNTKEIINNYTEFEDLRETICEFVKFRKLQKRPLTDHALKLLLNKLDSLASDRYGKINVLNQSMINGWQGIFALKDSAVKKDYDF